MYGPLGFTRDKAVKIGVSEQEFGAYSALSSYHVRRVWALAALPFSLVERVVLAV